MSGTVFAERLKRSCDRNDMKKIFTVDDLMVAVIAALGYGFGYSLAKRCGWPEAVCVAACLALGMALEEATGRIIFSKAIQRKRANRVLAYAVVLLIFVAAHAVSVRWLGESMLETVQEEVIYTVGFAVLGLIVNLFLRWIRAKRIRERYGDGEEGFVFDLTQEDKAETDKQNQRIHGEYDAGLAVKTRTGIYVGERNRSILTYLGIPYAKPPVGELRWKAPEPLPASEDVFEAVNFGASAIQVEHKGSIENTLRQSEDCLTLNIGVGDSKSEKPKPVLVLFHHGDFMYGGAVDPLQYGSNYLEKHPDTVFVSYNYRLGIFGFIDFSDVPGGEAYSDALNLGLLDQIAALEWIRENIAAFGGDPDRITVLGFEAGAVSILLLAASERAKGLFQRAFVFSGNLEEAYDTPERSRALAAELLKETRTSTMQELQLLSTATLKDAAQKLWRKLSAPTCDGNLIPLDVLRAYREGKASGIDFIIGFPGNETQIWRSVIGNQPYQELIASAVADLRNQTNGPVADAIREAVGAETSAENDPDAESKIVERWNALGIYRSAFHLNEGGNQVHLLYWNEKPLIEKLGSGTIDVAAVLLGNRAALEMYGNVMNQDLSEILQLFLHKFISGEALRLYHNEIHGVDDLNWKALPAALIISDGIIRCVSVKQ